MLELSVRSNVVCIHVLKLEGGVLVKMIVCTHLAFTDSDEEADTVELVQYTPEQLATFKSKVRNSDLEHRDFVFPILLPCIFNLVS